MTRLIIALLLSLVIAYPVVPAVVRGLRTGKLAQLREAMAGHGATHHLVSTVDDVAWALNLRGADVSYNPVFLAHLLVTAVDATLFVGEGKIDVVLKAALAADGVRLAPYADAASALAHAPASGRLAS